MLQHKASTGLLFVTIATALLCAPFLWAVYGVGDEGMLLRGAAELAAGKKIYADFFAFLPPGGYLIMEGWIETFGPSFLGIRIFAASTIVIISGFFYLSCLRVSGSAALSLFLTLAWVITSKSTWIVVISHHWLTATFSVAAFYFTLLSREDERNDTRIDLPFLAGVFAGAAAMVTSSCGVWVTFATAVSFIKIKLFPRQLVFCLVGCLTVPLLCLGYIIANGEFTPAFDDIVRFTLTQMHAVQAVPFGDGQAWYYPNRYLFPLAACLLLAMLFRDVRKYFADPQFRVCIFYGLAGEAWLFPRADLVHMVFAEPLLLPFVAYCASRLTARWRPLYRQITVALATLWCIPSAIGFVHQAVIAIRAPLTPTAEGPVFLHVNENNGAAALFSFLASTPPSDSILFYPYIPLISYLGQREQASRFDIFIPDYTTPAQYFEACQAVSRQAKWIVFDRAEMSPENWLLIFPAMGNPRRPETVAFEQAIEQNFVFVQRVGVFEIRQRTPATSDAACKAILQ